MVVQSRQVIPETTRLFISGGDWLLVKRRLNSGEQRRQYDQMYKDTMIGRVLDPLRMSMALVLAYLLDWSLVAVDGKPIPIANKNEADVVAALDSIDYDSFKEIHDAIEQHEEAMAKERAEEKKIQSGERPDVATSFSPSEPVGASSGSVS